MLSNVDKSLEKSRKLKPYIISLRYYFFNQKISTVHIEKYSGGSYDVLDFT